MIASTTDVRKTPKICFMIATLGHGRGGHFGSLKTTAEALARETECFIIDVGIAPSPVIESSFVRVYHVPFRGRRIAAAIGQISQIVKEERPDVLHLFDGRIDPLARLTSIHYHIPLLRTKCGGAPPRWFFPFYSDLILYSQQDMDWFSQSKRFSGSNIHLIPNRLAPFACDVDRMAVLRSHIEIGKRVILRIARFCKSYEESMVQGIRLVKRLNQEGQECQFVIVGTAEDDGVYERIAALADENICLFTEECFTLDANELIDIADVVIGTGRGFMEAASRGKVLLTPLADGSLPLLVTEDNFHEVFTTNFSPRNRVRDYDEETNYRRIKTAMEAVTRRAECQMRAHRWSAEYFEIQAVVEKYKALYSALRYRRHLPVLDLAHGLYHMARSFRSVHSTSGQVTAQEDTTTVGSVDLTREGRGIPNA